jgi:hypothetical protein
MWNLSATQIQAIAIVAQTLVFGLQTVVLIKTLSVVRKQATAADAQAVAAGNQANMAIKQVYANLAQADQSVRPLLTLEPINPRYREDDVLELCVRNDGLGPAFQIRAFLEEKVVDGKTFDRKLIQLFIGFLGVGKSTQLSVAARRLVFQDLVIEYHSAMRSTFATRYTFGDDGEYHLSEQLKEQPYATLADEQFRSLLDGNM